MYFLSFELMELKIAVELLGTVAYSEITSKRAGDFLYFPPHNVKRNFNVKRLFYYNKVIK